MDNDSINTNDESLVLDEAIALVEVDDVSDEINNVIDDFFVELKPLHVLKERILILFLVVLQKLLLLMEQIKL